MGAWGHGNFDNDDALDWFSEFEEAGVAAVSSALERVTVLSGNDYLEAPDASMALAAAEVVAAARDGNLSNLPDSVRQAFAKHRQSLAGLPLSELAYRAVVRVLRQSELKDLWEEGKEGQIWHRGAESLVSRLR